MSMSRYLDFLFNHDLSSIIDVHTLLGRLLLQLHTGYGVPLAILVFILYESDGCGSLRAAEDSILLEGHDLLGRGNGLALALDGKPDRLLAVAGNAQEESCGRYYYCFLASHGYKGNQKLKKSKTEMLNSEKIDDFETSFADFITRFADFKSREPVNVP